MNKTYCDMNIILLTIIEVCLVFITGSLVSIANTLWDILQELKNK